MHDISESTDTKRAQRLELMVEKAKAFNTDIAEVDLEIMVHEALEWARANTKLPSRRETLRTIVLGLALAALLSISNTAPASPRQMNSGEVNEILWAAVDTHWENAKNLPGLGFDGGDKPDKYYPRFFITQVNWAGPPNGGSCVVGFLAWDPKTADVWDGNVCEEIKSPKLLRLQNRIRAHMGISERAYKRLRVSGPDCE
jgi:hypothetical protein